MATRRVDSHVSSILGVLLVVCEEVLVNRIVLLFLGVGAEEFEPDADVPGFGWKCVNVSASAGVENSNSWLYWSPELSGKGWVEICAVEGWRR